MILSEKNSFNGCSLESISLDRRRGCGKSDSQEEPMKVASILIEPEQEGCVSSHIIG